MRLAFDQCERDESSSRGIRYGVKRRSVASRHIPARRAKDRNAGARSGGRPGTAAQSKEILKTSKNLRPVTEGRILLHGQ